MHPHGVKSYRRGDEVTVSIAVDLGLRISRIAILGNGASLRPFPENP